jgi:spore coat protein CotF
MTLPMSIDTLQTDMLAGRLLTERNRFANSWMWAIVKRFQLSAILLKQLEEMTEHARAMEIHYNVCEREQKFWMYRFSDLQKALREMQDPRGKRS